MRTGDTSAKDRQALIRRPPDLLITTPESLYLMLTSSARETLAGVEAVIIDEIHALAPTKRGAHLALSLERLEEITSQPPQRIGLSATQRPLEEVARFLGGCVGARRAAAGHHRRRRHPQAARGRGRRPGRGHGRPRPGDDGGAQRPGQRGAWRRCARASGRASTRAILELVLAHRSTIIFCNARRLAERLAARLNELAETEGVDVGEAGELVKAHHGSLAREQRVVIEDQLKRGELRGARRHVAASSWASTWARSTS